MMNSSDEDEITGINVTPLVDVMLVLLVVFMVTATYIVHKSIDVKLPTAETGTQKASTKNLAFAIDKDSNLFLDGEPITFNQISKLIDQQKKAASQSNQSLKLQALIGADQATPHGQVIKLIDTVRKNGISDFAINVETPTN